MIVNWGGSERARYSYDSYNVFSRAGHSGEGLDGESCLGYIPTITFSLWLSAVQFEILEPCFDCLGEY